MIYVAVFNGLILLRYALMRAMRARGQVYMPLLIALFVFSAFRFEVGCDWTGYLNQYYVYGRLQWDDILNENREALWVTLFVFQSWLELPYPWINVLSSLVFFYGAHVLARRQYDPLAFLVLLFPILIINMPMSAMRQGAAIGIMFIAFAAFNDRSIFRYVALTFVAAAFHAAALVFLLLAPLAGGQYSRSRLFLSFLLAIPGALLLMSGEAADVASGRYIDSGRDAAGAAFRVGLITLTGLYFLLFLRKKWMQTFPEDFTLVMVGALMMVGSLAILPISTIIADRLAYFLIPIQAIMFARIPFLPFRREHAFHIAGPYIVLITVFLVWTSQSWHFQQCYIPYQTWLFGMPEPSGLTF